MPGKYSPLNPANGKGLQSVYLASLPDVLGALFDELLLGSGNPISALDARGLPPASTEEIERARWEDEEVRELEARTLDRTEREALVMARRGQGIFRQNVARIEQSCRVTRVSNPTYLMPRRESAVPSKFVNLTWPPLLEPTTEISSYDPAWLSAFGDAPRSRAPRRRRRR